jgi:hypothetical protein
MTDSSEICARAWKLTAQFCVDTHPRIYDPTEPINRGNYVHGFLLARFQRMRDRMSSINLFSFVMPRVIRTDRIVPVIIILHGSHVLRQSTIEALLNGTVGCTVTCKPIHFGPGTHFAAVTLHPIYTAFLRMSSKDMGPDVPLRLRIDIEGNSEARPATISAHEEKCRPWAFTATFDPSLHTELITIVNDRREVSPDYIGGLLNRTLVETLDLLTFAVPLHPSSLINTRAVHVTGFLKNSSAMRRRTVEEVFPACAGLTVIYEPIHMGRGAPFASHRAFTEYIEKSTNDRAEATANPNILFRVDISGITDNVQPKKRGPKPGSRRRLEPLDGDLSMDKAAEPPPTAPTPPSAAPRLASEVIPRRPPPPRTVRRRFSAQPCRRVHRPD